MTTHSYKIDENNIVKKDSFKLDTTKQIQIANELKQDIEDKK